MPSVEREALSRTLAHLLRHEPWVYGVKLDAEGRADVDEVVANLRAKRYPELTRADVERAVRDDPRGRFGLREGKLRARYGHSVPIPVGSEAEPPRTLYAAVSRRRFREAATKGLRPRKGRAFVHLTEEPEAALEVGHRRDEQPVLLEVKAKEARKKGLAFRHSGDLWLVDEVPPEFLRARG